MSLYHILSICTRREAIRAIAMGPLGYDMYLLNTALSGPGYVFRFFLRLWICAYNSIRTKENVLTELLLSRNNTEIHLLTAGYRHKYQKELADVVRGDLSMKTARRKPRLTSRQSPFA